MSAARSSAGKPSSVDRANDDFDVSVSVTSPSGVRTLAFHPEDLGFPLAQGRSRLPLVGGHCREEDS